MRRVWFGLFLFKVVNFVVYSFVFYLVFVVFILLSDLFFFLGLFFVVGCGFEYWYILYIGFIFGRFICG